MGTANQFRIEYNPYLQTIKYGLKLSSASTWQPLATESLLIDNEKYQHAALLNVLDEIIPIIHRDYNFDSMGLEIVFCGTEDDFEDLREALKRFYISKIDNKPQMRCVKLIDEWYSAADEIIPDVEIIFAGLEATFLQQDELSLKQLLDNYQEAVSPVVPVCVMGTYSAGKSAFINALIGHEILPSDANPLTAKIFKISPDSACKAQFVAADVAIKVLFNNGEIAIDYNSELTPAVAAILNDIAAIESDSDIQMLAKAVSLINKAEMDINMIEITLPFNNTTLPLDRIAFEIYDTPGSDSATHKDHAKILADALQGRSNGLPILVTVPTELDKPGTAEIISIINRVGASMDRNNIIIAINKADTEDVETLKSLVSKNANTVIKNWKVNRMIFISAAMALGSKKTTNTWNDGVCRKVYRTQRDCFADPHDEDYLSLPQCNQLPEKRKNDICRMAQEAQDAAAKMPDDESTECELIAQNSGIRAVESEISYYGERHAAYNKCRMAILYLADAIRDTKAVIGTKTVAVDVKRREAQQKFDDCYNGLMNRINHLVETTNREFFKRVADVISADTESMFNWTEIASVIVQQCKAHKSDMDGLNNILGANFEQYRLRIEKSSFTSAQKACQHQEDLYKTACIAIINGDSQLTPDEKDFLAGSILQFPNVAVPRFRFDIRDQQLVKDKKFLFFKVGEKVDPEECVRRFSRELSRVKSDIISLIVGKYQQSFSQWSEKLTSELREQAKYYNPDLRQMNNDIDHLKKQIEIAEMQLAQLNGASDRIADLTVRHTK